MESLFRATPAPYSPYAPIRTRGPRRPRIPGPADREREIQRIGRQLRKVAQSLTWGRVQNDTWDRLCPFIFELKSADAVRGRVEDVARDHAGVDAAELIRYALRRWYCFWGARLAELLFLRHPNVRPGPPKDHQIDFYIDDVPFDLKTSEVPRAFQGGLPEILGDPARAIGWFYAHQSRERRFHLGNRLFLVLSDPDEPAQAWRLRGDVAALGLAIDHFLAAPTYIGAVVPDALGRALRVRSAILPVRPAPLPEQLRLALPASNRPRSVSKLSGPAGQIRLPF